MRLILLLLLLLATFVVKSTFVCPPGKRDVMFLIDRSRPTTNTEHDELFEIASKLYLYFDDPGTRVGIVTYGAYYVGNVLQMAVRTPSRFQFDVNGLIANTDSTAADGAFERQYRQR